MVIHDLRNPTVSLQNGIDIALTKLKNIDRYENSHSEMTNQFEKLNETR